MTGAARVPSPSENLPSTGFWELQDFAHEVGHIMGGHHTNCIALTSDEQGIVGRSYVDQCASDEYGCYSGDASSPLEGGTIMSSCFNISPATSRYVYGSTSTSDMSHHELDDYLHRIGGTVSGLPNIDSATTPLTLSPVNAPSSVPPSSTGNTASITAVSGALYSWSIAPGSGGAITAGEDTSSVTFSAPASGGVTLNVVLYNAGGCAGLAESKTIPTVPAPAAPTGLIATAASSNSVKLVWNQVSGSSIFYTIYRSGSTDYHTFARVGCTQQVPSSQSPYLDTALVGSNASYLYKVTAASGTFNSACPQPSGESGFSSADVATTVTIPTIASNVAVSADHINNLRTAAIALHKLANGPVATISFTDPTIGHCASDPQHCVAIKAVHINELRTPVTSDRQTLGLPAISFTDPVLTGCTLLNPSQCIFIKAVHFSQLRDAIQ
jgi:hypothetical protein